MNRNSIRPSGTARARWASAAALFVGSVVVLIALLNVIPGSVRPNESTDYTGYYRPVAENILDGEGLEDVEGDPAVRYPPGYPLILTAVFGVADTVGVSHSAAASIFKVLALAATCVLVFLISRMVFSEVVAWLAAALWLTYPINLMLATQPYSEIPFTLILYLIVLLLVQSLRRGIVTPRLALLLGVLVGTCSLIRPAAIAMALPLIAVLWMWSRKASRRSRGILALALLAGNLLVLAPWEVWAWDRTGDVIPLSSGGTESIVAGLTVGSQIDQEGHAGLPGDVADLMAEVADREDSFKTTGDVVSFLGDEFRARPLTVVKLVLVKAARSWYATDSLRNESYVAVLQVPYLVLGGLGLAQSLRGERLVRYAGVLVLLLTLYYWAVTITVTSIVRIMSPVAGLLLPFAAFALTELWTRLLGRAAHSKPLVWAPEAKGPDRDGRRAPFAVHLSPRVRGRG